MSKKAQAIYGQVIVSPEAIISFPSVNMPDNGKFGRGRYHATFLFQKGTDIKPLKDAIIKVAKEAFPGIKSMKEFHSPLRDGNEKVDEDGNIMKGYQDAIFVRATTNKRPIIVDTAKRVIDNSLIQGGNIVKASFTPASYVTNMVPEGKGVTLYLNNIQFIAMGEPFVNAPSGGEFESIDGASDEFSEFEEANDADAVFEMI